MAKNTMKFAQRSALAAAALASLAGAVQAQSVTLFGRIDAGIEYQNKVATADGDDSLTKLQNGGILPSIWGMRGSEDLGNGLKAVFNLESDFSSDTGGSRGLGNVSGLFGRQANVGLSGSFGTVLLGRQYSPAILADLGTDPRGFKESFSALVPYALAQLPEGNTGLEGGPNGLGIFTSNLISYSNAFGPLKVGIGYGFGEVAGETSQGSTIALGLTYTGPITVSGSFQRIEGIGASTDAETQRVSLGVAVPLGAITLKAYYAKSETDDAGGFKVSDADFFGVGANWAWNAQNTLTVAYYMGEDDEFDGDTSDLVISNDYAISKRTTLYGQFVYTDADSGSNTALSIAADRNPIRGEKTMIFGIGIMHAF